MLTEEQFQILVKNERDKTDNDVLFEFFKILSGYVASLFGVGYEFVIEASCCCFSELNSKNADFEYFSNIIFDVLRQYI